MGDENKHKSWFLWHFLTLKFWSYQYDIRIESKHFNYSNEEIQCELLTFSYLRNLQKSSKLYKKKFHICAKLMKFHGINQKWVNDPLPPLTTVGIRNPNLIRVKYLVVGEKTRLKAA